MTYGLALFRNNGRREGTSPTTSSDDYFSPTEENHDLQQTQDKMCRAMVGFLTEEEKEIAARSSYRYFIASSSLDIPNPLPGEREKMATSMARRHLIASNGDQDRALEQMRATILFRKAMKFDEIRRCFYVRDETSTTHDTLRNFLGDQLKTGKMFVRGKDNKKRAILSIFPRLYNNFPENFMITNIYTLERAIACTERATDGLEEKVIVMFDFNGFRSGDVPPLNVAVEILRCLRDHFPERLYRIYFLDAPFVFRAFWSLVKPFVDLMTVKKIKFVTGDIEKSKEFGDLIPEDEAMPFILPEGKLTDPVNMKEYLYDMPYDKGYDEK